MESSAAVTSQVSSVLRAYNPFLMTHPFLALNAADTSQSYSTVKSKPSRVFRAFHVQINIRTQNSEPNFTGRPSRLNPTHLVFPVNLSVILSEKPNDFQSFEINFKFRQDWMDPKISMIFVIMYRLACIVEKRITPFEGISGRHNV